MPDYTIGRLRGGYCVSWTDAGTGKRRRYQLKACTAKEAEAEAIDRIRRETAPPAGHTIATIWAAYRADRAGRRIGANMEWSGRAILPVFGALRPDQITTDDCRAYAKARAKTGRHAGTIWTELGHLRICLRWAEKMRLIQTAPHIERPQKPAPKERYLSDAEIDRLLSAEAEPHIRLAILLMLTTAARIGAVLDLTWTRVDLERGQINLRADAIGPRKGRAIVPINGTMRAALTVARQAALSEYVVEWGGDRVKSIRTGFSRAVERAGLEDVTPHVLRHTAAVKMAEGGVSMAEISQYLGHSNAQTTAAVYARFSPQHLRKAADILDFGKVRKVP